MLKASSDFSCDTVAKETAKRPDKNEAELLGNQLDGVNREIFKETNKNDKNSSKLKDLARRRKRLLVLVAREDPDKAAGNLLSASEKSIISALISNCVEKSVTIEGTLEVTHADSFNERLSATYYDLISGGKKISLHPAHLKKALVSGMKLKVHGELLDDDLIYDDDDPSTTTEVSGKSGFHLVADAYAEVADARGEQKTAVIMVNFQNVETTLTKATIDDMYFNQVKNYYLENSYQQTSITGTSFGWYALTIAQTCDYGQVLSQAVAAADSDINFTQYSRLAIVGPYGPHCWWSGLSTMGKTTLATADGNVTMSINWVRSDLFNLHVAGHEFGHGLTIDHASFLACGNVSWAQSGCTVNEYGDLYDIMGGNVGQWNALHRDYIGWFSPSNIQRVTASGTFNIEPIETATAGLKALKIQRSAYDYLYIEYRQPIGADSNLGEIPGTDVFAGALVHSQGSPYKSYLLDTTPPQSNVNTVIPVGGTFVDPETKTAITVNSKTLAGLTVTVTMGKTDFTPPTVSVTSPANGASVAGTVDITADASDDSGIDKVEFYGASNLIGTATSVPYTVSWDSTHAPNGTNGLWAIAYDKSGQAFNVAGNSASSSTVSVTVANVDPNPPQVTITAPTGGSLFNPITFSVDASDDVGIYKVELWADADAFPFRVFYASPYSASTTLVAGSHTIVAKAYDFVGNVTISSPVTFTAMTDSTPPTVSITSPLAGAKVSGIVSVSADATDDVGVSYVNFYLDGISGSFLGKVTSSPYSVFWDTTNLAQGVGHTISVAAFDAAGNNATASVNVTIADTIAPTVSITSPVNGSTVSKNSNVTINATATDNAVVSKVEFYVNGVLICTDSATAYSCVWKVPAKQKVTYSLQAKAYDSSNNISLSTISVKSK